MAQAAEWKLISSRRRRSAAAVALAEDPRGVAGELRVGVRLDLDLDRQVAGGGGEKLVQRQRPLGRRLAITIEDPSTEDLGGAALMGPAVERGAEREERIVKEHQLAVRGHADVGLEAVDPGRQRLRQGRGRGVGPIGTTQAVCV